MSHLDPLLAAPPPAAGSVVVSPYSNRDLSAALRQGELISSVRQWSVDLSTDSVSFLRHKLVIVVTQDCDLDWDHKQRESGDADDDKRRINDVLFLEAHLASVVREGYANEINSKIWNLIRQNRHPRYHFLEQVPPEVDLAGQGIDELTIDFKRYFTVAVDSVWEQIRAGGVDSAVRRTRLDGVYAQHLQQRFCSYLGRVGLPKDHSSI